MTAKERPSLSFLATCSCEHAWYTSGNLFERQPQMNAFEKLAAKQKLAGKLSAAFDQLLMGGKRAPSYAKHTLVGAGLGATVGAIRGGLGGAKYKAAIEKGLHDIGMSKEELLDAIPAKGLTNRGARLQVTHPVELGMALHGTGDAALGSLLGGVTHSIRAKSYAKQLKRRKLLAALTAGGAGTAGAGILAGRASK